MIPTLAPPGSPHAGNTPSRSGSSHIGQGSYNHFGTISITSSLCVKLPHLPTLGARGAFLRPLFGISCIDRSQPRLPVRRGMGSPQNQPSHSFHTFDSPCPTRKGAQPTLLPPLINFTEGPTQSCAQGCHHHEENRTDRYLRRSQQRRIRKRRNRRNLATHSNHAWGSPRASSHPKEQHSNRPQRQNSTDRRYRPGGEGITETLHLPTGSTTVSSTQYYATLTSITPSSTLGADTMDIGWAVNAVSAWQHCVTNVSVFNLGFGCTVTSGSPTYTVQSSFGDGTGFNHPTVASQTTSASGSVGYPIAALRLLFTAAGSVALNALQTDA